MNQYEAAVRRWETPDRHDIISSIEWSFWHHSSSTSHTMSAPCLQELRHVIRFKPSAKKLVVHKSTSPVRNGVPLDISNNHAGRTFDALSR